MAGLIFQQNKKTKTRWQQLLELASRIRYHHRVLNHFVGHEAGYSGNGTMNFFEGYKTEELKELIADKK